MTGKKKSDDCFLCNLNPWLLKGLLLTPFVGITLGTVGIFNDVGFGKTADTSPTPAVVVGVPTLNGHWVTNTPEPTPTASVGAAMSLPAPNREIVRITAPQSPAAPVMAVVTVLVPVVESPVRPTATAVPTGTPLPTATPCHPPSSRHCAGKAQP